MSSVISNELDSSSKGKVAVHQSIRELSITPASGSTSVTLAPSGTVNTKFYFGSLPHYKGKYSKLRGVLNVPGQGANMHIVVHAQPAMCVQNISLKSATGVDLVSVADCNAFLRLSSGALTGMDEFQTNDRNGAHPTLAEAYKEGSGGLYAPSNMPLSDISYGQGGRGASVRGAGPQKSNVAYLEQRYHISTDNMSAYVPAVLGDPNATPPTAFQPAVPAAPIPNEAMVLPFEFDFGLFKETYLANSKLDYSPKDMILSIDWCPTSNLGFRTEDVGVPRVVSQLEGPITVSDIELILAVESNVELSQAKMNSTHTNGFKTLIPYITAATNAHGAASSSSYSLNLNSSFGRSLLAIYVEVHNTHTDLDLAHDISNLGQSKVKTQRTKFDNQNITENILDCSRNQDYQYMQNILQDSVLYNSNVWNYNRVYIDSWRKDKSIHWDKNNNDGIEDGINLMGAVKSWQIALTTENVPLLERYWVVCQRVLTVDPSGNTTVV
jgi:hypothetical protein